MSTLGVAILSFPGMKHLTQTLASVRWADAIVMIHAGEGRPVITGAQPSSLVVRQVASAAEMELPLDEVRTDWLLRLWGDERLGPELEDELRGLCRLELATVKPSYGVRLRTLILNRWTDGSLWEPSPAPRVSRGTMGLLSGWWGRAAIEIQKTGGVLRGCIEDHGAVTLSDAMERVNWVTRLWVEDMRQRAVMLHPAALVLLPLRVFVRLLLFERLFACGLAGLTLSTLAAYATLLGGAKWWETRNTASPKHSA